MTKAYATITNNIAWTFLTALTDYFYREGYQHRQAKNPIFREWRKDESDNVRYATPTIPSLDTWESFDLKTQMIYFNHWINTNRRIFQTSEDVVISIDTTIKGLLPIQAYQDGDNIIVLCVNTAHPKLSHALIMSEYNPDWKLYEGNFFIALQAKNILENP